MTSSAIHCGSLSVKDLHGSQSVSKLYAIAHIPVMMASSDIFAPLSNKQTNHWTLYFQVGLNEMIEVDPSLGGNGTLCLTLQYIDNPDTECFARTFTLTSCDLTLMAFLECIIAAGYDKYKFTSSGQGCRHWIARVLQLLRSKGFLSDDKEVRAAIDGTRVVWDKGQPAAEAAQTSPEKGTFL